MIKFLPGVHTVGIKKGSKKTTFRYRNSIDSTEPIPIGIMLSGVKHFRACRGSGVAGAGKTMLLYDGRMMQILNEDAEDIEYSGLVLDMKRRTAVSEIRVLEVQDSTATIQVAEGSDYRVEDGKFFLAGATGWGGSGLLTQEVDLKTGACAEKRRIARAGRRRGQIEAKATDLGNRRVKLEFPDGASGLVAGHQYHFRNVRAG